MPLAVSDVSNTGTPVEPAPLPSGDERPTPQGLTTADTEAAVTVAASTPGVKSKQAERLAALREPLASLQGCDPLQRLTRSERIFSCTTGTDPTASRISSTGMEHKVFMEARFAGKWASYNMTPSRYQSATQEYNMCLDEALQGEGKILYVKKISSAVLQRLAEVEQMLIQRIVMGNFLTKDGTSKAVQGMYSHTTSSAQYSSHLAIVALRRPNRGRRGLLSQALLCCAARCGRCRRGQGKRQKQAGKSMFDKLPSPEFCSRTHCHVLRRPRRTDSLHRAANHRRARGAS